MPADLFEVLREAKRERLRSLGWFQGTLGGLPSGWINPEGGNISEEEALLWLARHEAERGKKSA